jgi:hypothetical protein
MNSSKDEWLHPNYQLTRPLGRGTGAVGSSSSRGRGKVGRERKKEKGARKGIYPYGLGFDDYRFMNSSKDEWLHPNYQLTHPLGRGTGAVAGAVAGTRNKEQGKRSKEGDLSLWIGVR